MHSERLAIGAGAATEIAAKRGRKIPELVVTNGGCNFGQRVIGFDKKRSRLFHLYPTNLIAG